MSSNFEEFMPGFVYGLEQKDITPDIAKCSAAEQKMVPYIQKVVADLQEGTLDGFKQALTDMQAVIKA